MDFKKFLIREPRCEGTEIGSSLCCRYNNSEESSSPAYTCGTNNLSFEAVSLDTLSTPDFARKCTIPNYMSDIKVWNMMRCILLKIPLGCLIELWGTSKTQSINWGFMFGVHFDFRVIIEHYIYHCELEEAFSWKERGQRNWKDFRVPVFLHRQKTLRNHSRAHQLVFAFCFTTKKFRIVGDDSYALWSNSTINFRFFFQYSAISIW